MCSIHRGTIIRLCILVACLLLLKFSGNAEAGGSAAVRTINSTGGGMAEIAVKNIDNNQPAVDGLITWSEVRAGEIIWKIADQYIEISQQGLPAFWGIQIYCDNKNGSPQYTGVLDPAGLVKITDEGNSTTALSMAWRVTDSLIPADELATPIEQTDREGFKGYTWHFLKDKNTPDKTTTDRDERFVNGEDYVTFWNQAGIAWNEGGRAHNPKKAYIYFAAKFIMANVNTAYKTSTLAIEAYEGISPFPIYLYKDAPKTETDSDGSLLYPDGTLENHFAPSGWMNYDDAHQIIEVDPACKEVAPYSGEHCFKIQWNGDAGVDGKRWGGIMWLEPEDIWGLEDVSLTHNGYDLRGANYLKFWAKTDLANEGLKIQVYFGNTRDSCGKIPPAWRSPALTTEWQEYTITILYRDMSNVTGGLAVVFNEDHDPDPDGCVIYLDDIKFDKD